MYVKAVLWTSMPDDTLDESLGLLDLVHKVRLLPLQQVHKVEHVAAPVHVVGQRGVVHGGRCAHLPLWK